MKRCDRSARAPTAGGAAPARSSRQCSRPQAVERHTSSARCLWHGLAERPECGCGQPVARRAAPTWTTGSVAGVAAVGGNPYRCLERLSPCRGSCLPSTWHPWTSHSMQASCPPWTVLPCSACHCSSSCRSPPLECSENYPMAPTVLGGSDQAHGSYLVAWPGRRHLRFNSTQGLDSTTAGGGPRPRDSGRAHRRENPPSSGRVSVPSGTIMARPEPALKDSQ